MNKRLLNLYSLKFNPFSPQAPVTALWTPPQIQSFCWRIEQQVGEGGFALVAGDPGLVAARAECARRQAAPGAPEPALGPLGAEAAAAVRAGQACDRLEADLRDFLGTLRLGPGLAVDTLGEPVAQDGMRSAEVWLRPPGWSSDRGRLDRVTLVQDARGDWHAERGGGSTGARAANFFLAFPWTADWVARRNVQEALKKAR